MRRPLKQDVNAPDEWYFRFKSHSPNENKVTIRVTESERDGKLIVDLDSAEGDVSVRDTTGTLESLQDLVAAAITLVDSRDVGNIEALSKAVRLARKKGAIA